MFRKFISASVAAIILTSQPALAWQQITTEQQFVEIIAEKPQVDTEGRGHVTWHTTGSVTGEWQGNPVVGAWEWHDKFLCRNLRIGSHETGTNCLRLDIQGKQLRARQDRGRGTQTITQMQ